MSREEFFATLEQEMMDYDYAVMQVVTNNVRPGKADEVNADLEARRQRIFELVKNYLPKENSIKAVEPTDSCPYTFAHTKKWCGYEGCRES